MKVFTVPNWMSFFRILLIPTFCVLFLCTDSYKLAGIVLLLSGLTDLLDGFIARRFNQESELGKLLDPIADKLTLAAVVVCIWYRFKDIYPILTPLFAVMILKEFIMMLGGLVLVRKGKKIVKAQWWGKVGTVGFYLLMTGDIIAYSFCQGELRDRLILIMTVLAAALMLFALACYVVLGIRLLNDKVPEDKNQIVNLRAQEPEVKEETAHKTA